MNVYLVWSHLRFLASISSLCHCYYLWNNSLSFSSLLQSLALVFKVSCLICPNWPLWFESLFPLQSFYNTGIRFIFQRYIWLLFFCFRTFIGNLLPYPELSTSTRGLFSVFFPYLFSPWDLCSCCPALVPEHKTHFHASLHSMPFPFLSLEIQVHLNNMKLTSFCSQTLFIYIWVELYSVLYTLYYNYLCICFLL